MRARAHLDAIRAVVDVFGKDSGSLVFLGGCALGIYARPTGSPLRVTKDVDCLSIKKPWVAQEAALAQLCAFGTLVPVIDTAFRYKVAATGLVVDVLSPEGFNIGGKTASLQRAAARAIEVSIGGAVKVRVVAPAHFLVLKLEAFLDRGPDLESAKDIEDIVTLAVEREGLVEEVEAEQLGSEIGGLWERLFKNYSIDSSYLADIVDYHLHRDDGDRRERAIQILTALVRG